MVWKTEEILVLVKVYPTPSNKYGETVCTAGITRQFKWIRLYPIPYRDLPNNQKYDKFQWIRVKITPSNEKLKRPESYKVDASSIKLLEKIPPGTGWIQREKYFIPAVSKSLEELVCKKEQTNTSLGAFMPKTVEDFKIYPDSGAWNEKQLGIVSQTTLFNRNKSVLKKVPYKFRYLFTCNDTKCHGHDIQIFDWEAAQSYWNFKHTYKTEELTLQKFREKWLDYFFKVRESYFVVGTDSHWNNFMILTIISPRRRSGQLRLL